MTPMTNEIDRQILSTLAHEEELLFWDLAKQVGEDAKTLWVRVEALAAEGKIEMINSGLASDPFYLSITHLGSLDLPQEGKQQSQTIQETDLTLNDKQTEETTPEIDLIPPVMDNQLPIEDEKGFFEDGWIKLHRKIIENPIFKDSEALHLFIYLLLRANHKANKFPFNQKEMVVKRGQLVTGVRKISSDTGISEWKIRDRLKLLENLSITTRKTTHRFSIISICNYNHYQETRIEESHTKPHTEYKDDDQIQIGLPPHTDHTLTTTNKNDKKKTIGRKKPPDPRIKEFFSYWGETFQKEIGQPYTFSYAKDGNLTKNLLTVHELPTLQQLTKTFFKDEQAKRRGLTIGIFYQEINRLLSLKAMDPLEQAKRELSRRKE